MPAVPHRDATPQGEPLSTEEEALEALDRGDRRRALTILMRDYGTPVFHYCQQHLRDPDLAEDVHQQVFVQAWTDLPRYSRRSSLKTWLFGIAHHRCQDAAKIRRRFFARFTAQVDELPEVEDPAPVAEDQLVMAAERNDLARCLEALAPAARLAVGLRYTEGFTFEQMAAICREKPGTLQARVARALPAVKKCLERRGLAR